MIQLSANVNEAKVYSRQPAVQWMWAACAEAQGRSGLGNRSSVTPIQRCLLEKVPTNGLVVEGWLGRGTTVLHCTHHVLTHRLEDLSLFLFAFFFANLSFHSFDDPTSHRGDFLW